MPAGDNRQALMVAAIYALSIRLTAAAAYSPFILAHRLFWAVNIVIIFWKYLQ